MSRLPFKQLQDGAQSISGTGIIILEPSSIVRIDTATIVNLADIVNKEYVDINILALTASNGLTKTGVDTKLGGTLTVDTNLALDSFTLGITGEGNLNTEITFPTSIDSIFDQTGADLFGLKALVPLPNGVNGKGIMYVEDASNFIDSNAARILAGNLSDFGLPGTGTAISIGVGDFSGNIADNILAMFTDYAAGESTIYAGTTGYDSGNSMIVLSADHNDDIIYSGLQLRIGGPTGNKAVILHNDNWSVQDDVNSTGYRFPWANGTAGQVLADDGNGSHDLEWVDLDQVSPFTVVTDAATITWDASTTPNGSITLGGNRTLNDPTGLVNGRTYNLVIKQDFNGFRILTFGLIYKWSGGVAPTLSTGSKATDFFTFIYDGTNLYGNAILNFS